MRIDREAVLHYDLRNILWTRAPEGVQLDYGRSTDPPDNT
jgi:hypothetical protein